MLTEPSFSSPLKVSFGNDRKPAQFSAFVLCCCNHLGLLRRGGPFPSDCYLLLSLLYFRLSFGSTLQVSFGPDVKQGRYFRCTQNATRTHCARFYSTILNCCNHSAIFRFPLCFYLQLSLLMFMRVPIRTGPSLLLTRPSLRSSLKPSLSTDGKRERCCRYTRNTTCMLFRLHTLMLQTLSPL